MIDDNGLLRQAKMTGKDYLDAASSYLLKYNEFPHTFENAMRLAELMAKDYETEILERIADSLEKRRLEP